MYVVTSSFLIWFSEILSKPYDYYWTFKIAFVINKLFMNPKSRGLLIMRIKCIALLKLNIGKEHFKILAT